MSDRYPKNDSGQDIPEDYGWLGYVAFIILALAAMAFILWLAR